ncbi:MAG: hypothetical protein PHE78_05800 [Candidatus Gastranaerophilales bacterium]|nr:hypothetical protein [Candidatus Gastranaerophilales bacterium]
MIGAISQNSTYNHPPNFKAAIPIRSLKITDHVNINSPKNSSYVESFDFCEIKSAVNDLRKVLFKKDNSEKDNPFYSWLNQHIRKRFVENSKPKDYSIYDNAKYYDFYNKKLVLERFDGQPYLLIGDDAKVISNLGMALGRVKAEVKNEAIEMADEYATPEEIDAIKRHAIEFSPEVRLARQNYAIAMHQIMSRVDANQPAVDIFAQRKKSGALKALGVVFE